MKTLIVEDDFASRLLLQTVLSRYGECHVAINGKEAVQAFQMAQASGRNYDLICMDIMMPEMDGQAALRQVRELEARLRTSSSAAAKVLMTTALTDVKDVISAFQGLCDGYLFKPIELRKLQEQLREFRLIQ